jgi:hypothetical protein
MMCRPGTRRPNHDHHAAVQKAGGDVAHLAVILAVIDRDGVTANEDLCGIGEVDTSLSQRLSRLAGSKAIFTYFLYIQLISVQSSIIA